MNLLTQRLTYFYAFVSVMLMITLAFYLQFWKGIAPCPLCILQRIIMIGIGVTFFLGMTFVLKQCGRIFIASFAFLLSLGGALLAGRQVWIQHLPPSQSADCGVSLEYMLHVLPWDQVAKKILEGSAECSMVTWSFWGLSMAEWSLLGFILFAVFALWQMVRKNA